MKRSPLVTTDAAKVVTAWLYSGAMRAAHSPACASYSRSPALRQGAIAAAASQRAIIVTKPLQNRSESDLYYMVKTGKQRDGLTIKLHAGKKR